MKRVLRIVVVALVGTLAWVAAQEQPKKGRRVALLVAVQDYADSGLTSLKYTENDVTALGTVLKAQGYRDDDIITLTDTAAAEKKKLKLMPTADHVRRELKGLVEDLRPEDTFLVAFSGHGVHLKQLKEKGLHFCAKGTSLDDPKTMVSLADVYDTLEKDCKAGVKLLFVDACRNDPTDGKAAGDGRLASSTRPLVPDPPGGTVAFFSCSTGQQSYESDSLKHGIFFHHVITGLKGGPADDRIDRKGEVTVPLLEDYLTRTVPVAVKKDRDDRSIRQVPERKGSLRGQVVLTRVDAADIVRTESFDWKGEIKTRRVMALDLGGEHVEFVEVAKGSFLMGTSDSEKSTSEMQFRGYDEYHAEKPQHRVTFTKPLWVAKYPVTKSQFAAFVKAVTYSTEPEADGKGGSGYGGNSHSSGPKFNWMNTGWPQTDKHPVVNITWTDAQKYCGWAMKECGKRVRLLTEAEYEYANRGGTTTPYFTGEEVTTLEGYANMADKSYGPKCT